jgi:5-oxoprolinase (ATP-hydrolysing) subunit A
VPRPSIRSIDLNADLGEHEGAGFESDSALLDLVSSANIACGAHAGSPEVMRMTVATAYEKGVAIGAHPGYPDREGFGRRELDIGMAQIIASVEAQIELMAECCAVEGARLSYVKPHGALYNRAARDADLAGMLSSVIAKFDSSLIVLALADGALEREAHAHGLRVAREAFIDRSYREDGSLVPRGIEGALIDNPSISAERAVRIAADNEVVTLSGTVLQITPDSLCVHGDSLHALDTLRATRQQLERAGITILPFA